MKNVAVIGSTGSIGRQTLNVIRRHPDKFKVTALFANNSAQLLKVQAEEFKPEYLGIGNPECKSLLKTVNASVSAGEKCLEELCAKPETDVVVVSVVGMAGLDAVISALKNNKIVALANKESLVAGGELIKNICKETNGTILPIDSEHSAVWQCLDGKKDLKRIILTASGGPFRGYTAEKLKTVTIEQALRHPNWSMGKKITIDSATMMNKALEIIEARWLFDTTDIDYVIHPESIIHSMVEFKDGSIIAQMAQPNMEIPIAYALSYPERLDNEIGSFNFDKALTFAKPDEEVFKAPRLAYTCLRKGGNSACVLNAANEAAVELFLKGKIEFCEITEICADAIERFGYISEPDINDLHVTFEKVRKSIIG